MGDLQLFAAESVFFEGTDSARLSRFNLFVFFVSRLFIVFFLCVQGVSLSMKSLCLIQQGTRAKTHYASVLKRCSLQLLWPLCEPIDLSMCGVPCPHPQASGARYCCGACDMGKGAGRGRWHGCTARPVNVNALPDPSIPFVFTSNQLSADDHPAARCRLRPESVPVAPPPSAFSPSFCCDHHTMPMNVDKLPSTGDASGTYECVMQFPDAPPDATECGAAVVDVCQWLADGGLTLRAKLFAGPQRQAVYIKITAPFDVICQEAEHACMTKTLKVRLHLCDAVLICCCFFTRVVISCLVPLCGVGRVADIPLFACLLSSAPH